MVLLGQSLLSSIIEILVRHFSKNVQTVLSLCDIVLLHAVTIYCFSSLFSHKQPLKGNCSGKKIIFFILSIDRVCGTDAQEKIFFPEHHCHILYQLKE